MFQGSPPLTRGKVGFLLLLMLIQRITPAYAGKSGNLARSHEILQDHPRLRGEKH